jgi:hypothetical protein
VDFFWGIIAPFIPHQEFYSFLSFSMVDNLLLQPVADNHFSLIFEVA